MVHAFVLVDALPARVADLAGELADVEGVAEVYSVAGEADLVAIIRVRQHDELAEVVTRGIAKSGRDHQYPDARRLPGLQPAGSRSHVGPRGVAFRRG